MQINVFKASAGSGKTFTLAVQYIHLLITLNPQEYKHTLAVTFTNKATAEMKDRILEQLYGISRMLPSSKGYLDALHTMLNNEGMNMSDEIIRERCTMALRFILHDYSHFRIETIDSFFQSVMRNLAHELGLNARMQVDLNDKQILSQAVDNLVDGLGKKEEGDVMAWIDNYVRQEIENADNWDVRKKIKSLAGIIFKEDYLKRDEEENKKLNDETRIRQYRKELMQIKAQTTNILNEAAKELERTINAYDGDITKSISSGSWVLGFRDKMMSGNYEKGPTEKQMESLQSTITMVKKGDQKNTAMLTALEPVREALLDMEQIRKKCLNTLNTISLSLNHLNPLRLLNHIEHEVVDITNETNRFVLAKTTILLARMVGDSDAPFVFEKMGTQFNNVMIDEFQDTSQLQWKNFKSLLLESQSKGGNNLVVGDIKQSIYRFRNGDWRLLKNIDNEMGHNKPIIHTLDTNYRSDANVINFNNNIFRMAAQQLSEEEGMGIIKEIYEDVSQKYPANKKEEGLVRVMLRTDKEKGDVDSEWEEKMLQDMCKQIRQLNDNGLPYSQMAVLLRRRSHIPKLLRYVQEHMPDVKMVSDEGFLLSSSVALNMLVAALRVISMGNQDPVAERFLIQNYLLYINKEESTTEFATAKAEDVLPAEFVEKQKELAQYPLNELCEHLYRILHLDKIDGEDAYVLSFFDELSNYLAEGTSDINSFIEYWETDLFDHSIPACKVNGISIVTIHKSKGLQYHTVFMPWCDETMEDVRADSILWCDSKNAPYNTLGSLPITGRKETFEQSEYKDSFKEERLQRRIEELNVLYVAFTRAEHNLYVWGDATGTQLTYAKILNANMEAEMTKIAIDGNTQPETFTMSKPNEENDDKVSVWQYGAMVTPSTNKEAQKKPTKSKEVNRMSPDFETHNIAFCSHNRRLDFRQSNEAEQYVSSLSDEEADTTQKESLTADGLSYVEQGKLLHEVFSRIEHADQVERVLQTYMDEGILSSQKQVERIAGLIQRGLNNPQVKDWFSREYKIQNECEIIHLDAEGRHVSHRPDRVMISPTNIIIVDFKFGRPNPEKYSEQLKGYTSLMQQMYPNHHITAYLWYVYRNEIVEV